MVIGFLYPQLRMYLKEELERKLYFCFLIDTCFRIGLKNKMIKTILFHGLNPEEKLSIYYVLRITLCKYIQK